MPVWKPEIIFDPHLEVSLIHLKISLNDYESLDNKIYLWLFTDNSNCVETPIELENSPILFKDIFD